ncbi:hypothetical protein DL95DRAFT_412652 [Leptodontidium sp. 2 PMI_412]|nr:hypothetical protein DL95DRAFT_412652 [Leptodontidium sp. 2 PMI_412]
MECCKKPRNSDPITGTDTELVSPAAEPANQPSGGQVLPLLRLSGWDNEDKFPGDKYTCEETIIEVSVERSRRRGLTKRYKKLEIDWQLVDEHLEGLSHLFSMGRKITFSMEFVYKEVTCDSTTAKGKKKKSATEAQRLQRAADAGLWTRVYEHYRCRAKHCK